MEVETKEIKCPQCNNIIILNENSEKLECNNCKKDFIYKYCLECSQIIFFYKIFYDGYNIQCPYISCGATHCSVKCENKECGKLIFYKNKYSQGDLIKCSNCKLNFKKVKCPDIDCPNNITLKETFLEGNPIECQHKNGKFIFQKINCWYCGRHCIWNNSKGKYYIEGQMIFCPYKECERITNKVNCPKCLNSSVITRGNLDMGKRINCSIKGCNCIYNIYFCPYCKKTNYGNGSPIVGKNLMCNFCKGEFSFINCFACKQIHFWKNPNKYLPCQTIICANEGCKKQSAVVPCPNCKKIYYFAKGIFTLGKKYECSHECKKEFVILYCGKCNMTYTKQANLAPNILYTCENCKNIMPTVQCPKCFKFVCLENNTKIESHSMVKCPYEKCRQIFCYYICPYCKHDYNNDKYICNNIKCPFENCNKVYTYFKCKKCLKDNYIENVDNNNMDCEEINCLYCNENNEISNQPNESKIINVKKVNITQGEKYIFDNPEEDQYDRSIINNLIHINDYDIPFEEKKAIAEENANKEKMCVICMANPIQWILVDCGHKCVCEYCGEIVKEKYRKCPICKKKIIGVLKKVIDD